MWDKFNKSCLTVDLREGDYVRKMLSMDSFSTSQLALHGPG